MVHYEVCWLDGVSGEHLTPNLRRGNAYVVVTSANMHVVPMRGVVPAVATVPLDEIDQVNSIGAVKDGFFYSYVWGEPKAMAVAKRFDVVRRRGVEPLPEVVGGASRDPDPVPIPRTRSTHTRTRDRTTNHDRRVHREAHRVCLFARGVDDATFEGTRAARLPDGRVHRGTHRAPSSRLPRR